MPGPLALGALRALPDDLKHVHAGTLQEHLQGVNKQACGSGRPVMAIAMAFDHKAAGILVLAVACHADPFFAPRQEGQQGADIKERRAAIGADTTGANRGIRHAAPEFTQQVQEKRPMPALPRPKPSTPNRGRKPPKPAISRAPAWARVRSCIYYQL